MDFVAGCIGGKLAALASVILSGDRFLELRIILLWEFVHWNKHKMCWTTPFHYVCDNDTTWETNADINQYSRLIWKCSIEVVYKKGIIKVLQFLRRLSNMICHVCGWRVRYSFQTSVGAAASQPVNKKLSWSIKMSGPVSVALHLEGCRIDS